MPSSSALLTSQLASLPLIARGKVRDNYAVGNDRILMVASEKKLEEEKEQFTKEEVQNKVSQIKKKMKLKEIISKANMYFDEDEYMFSLIEFQKVLKEVPNDEVTNIKV